MHLQMTLLISVAKLVSLFSWWINLSSAASCTTVHTKQDRITRSSLAGETIALVEAFDHSYLLKHDLQRILGKRIPFHLMTDSKLLFDVITGNLYTTKARLIMDIATVRESHNQHIVSNIALPDRVYKIVDPFKKIVHCPLLERVMFTGYLNHSIWQYVLDTSIDLC